jgi:hypothetical protein
MTRSDIIKTASKLIEFLINSESVDSSLRWWYGSSQYTVCEVYCWMMILGFDSIYCVIYM